MRTVRTAIASTLTVLLALSSPAMAAQRHAVAPAAVADAVAQHVAQQDTDRATVKDVLARPEVQRVAAALGIDSASLSASVDTMSPESLAQAANQAQQVNSSLVGGASTVTISTTTIVIALLVLIIILVAD